MLKPKDQNAIKYRAHIKARVEAASAVASTSTRETTGRGKVLEYRSGNIYIVHKNFALFTFFI